MPKIAILTPAPDYWEDWSVPKAHYLRLLGRDVTFRSWTEPCNLTGFDLILPLLAWGYQRDCLAWFDLLDALRSFPLANPAKVLRWNSDKAYLIDLEREGVSIVPTLIRESLSNATIDSAREIFGCGRLVVKPPVSGGADGTFLIGPSDPLPAGVAGQRMLVQPYMPTIADEGEYSLFYFGGHFSHSISKHPANGDFRVQEQFGGVERKISAPEQAKLLAEAALSATDRLMGCGSLTYARIDMVRGSGGAFQLMELELIEPSLFLQFADDQGQLFAETVKAALHATR